MDRISYWRVALSQVATFVLSLPVIFIFVLMVLMIAYQFAQNTNNWQETDMTIFYTTSFIFALATTLPIAWISKKLLRIIARAQADYKTVLVLHLGATVIYFAGLSLSTFVFPAKVAIILNPIFGLLVFFALAYFLRQKSKTIYA